MPLHGTHFDNRLSDKYLVHFLANALQHWLGCGVGVSHGSGQLTFLRLRKARRYDKLTKWFHIRCQYCYAVLFYDSIPL